MKNEYAIALAIVGFLIVVMFVTATLPTCTPGEVMVRGVTAPVCVSGFR